MSLRVVAGEWGGRRLRSPVGPRTRPTADRVREALFSILGPLERLQVLDLYAGSGALGIEALSRGAGGAVFVDRSEHAVAVIRANLRTVGAEAQVLRRDALGYLRSAAGKERFDLVLVDPPYSAAPRLGAALASALPPVLADDARIVSESDKRHPLTLDLPLVLERTYGDTRIAVHRGA